MTENNTSLAVRENSNAGAISPFSSISSFVDAQRMCAALTGSVIVPEIYRGKDNVGNALVALEMAQRTGASVMAVMQNLHIIQGRPSWSSSFIISALNTCGRFSPLRYTITREPGKRVVVERTWKDKRTGERRTKTETTDLAENVICAAWATDEAGERLEGPPVSYEMAVREGWWTKPDSKWQTMPELMIRYRAAAFFGRLYAPEVLNGMHTEDEVRDIIDVSPSQVSSADAASVSISDIIAAAPKAEPVTVAEPVEEAPKPERKRSAPKQAKREPEPVIDVEPESEAEPRDVPTFDDDDAF